MQLLVTAVNGSSGQPVNLFVNADSTLPLSTLFPSLVNFTGADFTGATAGLAVDGKVLSLDTPISASGIRDGSVITLLDGRMRAPGHVGFVPSVVQLRVVSGANAGRVTHAGPGMITVGSRPDVTVHVTDPRAAPVEFVVNIAADQTVTLVDVSPVACGTIDGHVVHDGQVATWGTQIAYADRILELAPPEAYAAAVTFDSNSGHVVYNRPPRILPPEQTSHFRLPAKPTEPEKQPLPILMAMLPLAVAIGAALLYRNPTMLVFGLMSPVMLVGSYITNRRSGRRRYRRQTIEHKELSEKITRDAAKALATERVSRREADPDPAEVASIATIPTPRLWQRRIGDPSWLSLRIGTATLASTVTLEDPEQLEHKQTVTWDIQNTPAALHLDRMA